MLASRCYRIAASAALRRSSRAARTCPSSGFLSNAQARSFLSAQISRETRSPRTLRYSTSSNTGTNPPDAALPEKPDYLNNAESAIWDKLVAEFSPTELIFLDVSGGCGSMYAIQITSEKFRGINMLKQQRMVNAVLGEEMKNWHGVQLRTRTP
ncbi:bola-like protein [Xylaria sp. FL0933]|nr:bola-like protein [Xylaria sp. FL0933]